MEKKSTKILFLTATFVIYWQSANSLAEINELIQQGDDALKMNNTEFADNAYTRALELDPKNFRVLRSLAKIRFNAKKYTEAEKLVTRILALPISIGRSVLVHLKGEAEPLEAELVDETVMMNPMVPKDEPKGVEEKYLKFHAESEKTCFRTSIMQKIGLFFCADKGTHWGGNKYAREHSMKFAKEFMKIHLMD